MSYMTHGMHRLKLLTIVLVLGITLSACGDTTPPKPADTTQSNEWDNMKWDQSPWG